MQRRLSRRTTILRYCHVEICMVVDVDVVCIIYNRKGSTYGSRRGGSSSRPWRLPWLQSAGTRRVWRRSPSRRCWAATTPPLLPPPSCFTRSMKHSKSTFAVCHFLSRFRPNTHHTPHAGAEAELCLRSAKSPTNCLTLWVFRRDWVVVSELPSAREDAPSSARSPSTVQPIPAVHGPGICGARYNNSHNVAICHSIDDSR